MRHLSSFASVFGFASLIASSALAQTPPPNADEPVAPAPVAAPAPVDQPIAPAPGVRPATLQPEVKPPMSSCGPGAVQGVYPADAQTGVWLVCEEVRRRQGLPLSISPSEGPAAYRVGMLRLGNSVILTLQVEAPIGTIRDGRQLRLATIEELPVAAPRLVDALWRGVPVTSTQKVSNLVGEETREYQKKPGEFLWGGGLMGVVGVGSGAGMQPGIDLRAGYETERYGIGLDLRFGAGSDGNDDKRMDYVAFGIGGRYFLSDGNTGPFVGGGLTWSGIEVRGDDLGNGYGVSGSGMGAYGEAGVEFLRLHSSRLTFDVRFETPFYQLKAEQYAYGSYYDAATDSYVNEAPSDDKKYVVPIMAGLTYTF